MENSKFIQLKNLEVYTLSRELSKIAWEVYNALSWQDKKTMGDQYLSSTDSMGANIAEGYFRYHFLDRIKFYYNARASLAECSEHWMELLYERDKVNENIYKKFKELAGKLSVKLNNFISSTYKAKEAQLISKNINKSQ